MKHQLFWWQVSPCSATGILDYTYRFHGNTSMNAVGLRSDGRSNYVLIKISSLCLIIWRFPSHLLFITRGQKWLTLWKYCLIILNIPLPSVDEIIKWAGSVINFLLIVGSSCNKGSLSTGSQTLCEHRDVIMGTMASQITSLTTVYSSVYSQIKEDIKAPRHWPLCGEFTGDRWIPRTKGQ